jgi:hypothetical protein
MRPILNYSSWQGLHEARKRDSFESLDLKSRSPKWSVRAAVAENPNCPVEILDRLSKDDEDKVRWRVAGNPNCPVEILDRLSRDPKREVRYRVPENPNCPVEILAALSTDRDEVVRSTAADRLARVKAERPELRDRIEELENLAALGIRGDEEAPDLSDLDI